MVGARKVTAVQWVRHALRTVGVTGSAVETGAEAAGCRLPAAQILAVTSVAGRRAVQCSEPPVVNIGIDPSLRVEAERRRFVVRMAAEAADGITSTEQIGTMTCGAIVIAGIGECFLRMGREPALWMGI
jgi:hypothetical protein